MKKVNKLVACLLAGTLVLSLTACGSPEGNGNSSDAGNTTDNAVTTPADSGETTPSTDGAENTDTAPAEVVKPETITVMWDGTIFKEGENYAQEFYDALDEALGLHVDWKRPDHSTYSEQVGIAFTDQNTLADVVILPASLYAAYAAQGNLWNMTDAWNNSETANSGRITATGETIVKQWYTTGPDGQEGIYGMYPARGNGTITYVKSVAAEAAGYTEDTLPTTWEEFQTFLLALKDATGVPPLLAPAFFDTDAPYVNYMPEFFQGAYPDFYQQADGTWVDGFSQQSMIDAMDRLAWAYSNGVLDPEIFESPGTAKTRDKFYLENGTSVFNYWAGTWAYTIKSKLASNYTGEIYPDAEAYQTVWAMKPIAEVGTYMERYSPMICITSACDNPEGVFQYFIDKILDGGDVQMLWQYGVEGVHYEWNEDGATISGLPTEVTKGTEKESMTSKNLFEANLKIGSFSGTDPYTPADPVIDEAFKLFDENSSPAPKINSSEEYRTYSSDLWDERRKLVAAVAKGEMTGAEAIEEYNSVCGEIVEAILASYNQ